MLWLNSNWPSMLWEKLAYYYYLENAVNVNFEREGEGRGGGAKKIEEHFSQLTQEYQEHISQLPS